MTDLQQMGGKVDPPETAGEETVLTGTAPVAGLRDYAREVAAYTRGQGRLSCVPAGLCPLRGARRPCIEAIGYDPERDVENTGGLRVLLPRGRCGGPVGRGAPSTPRWTAAWRPEGTEPEPKEAAPQRRPVSTYAGTASPG